MSRVVGKKGSEGIYVESDRPIMSKRAAVGEADACFSLADLDPDTVVYIASFLNGVEVRRPLHTRALPHRSSMRDLCAFPADSLPL